MRYQTQDRIRKLSYLIKRWWLFIVVFVFTVLSATYWITQKIPAQYQAFATLEVKTNDDAVRSEDFSPNLNSTEYLSTQLMRLRSGSIIDTVLEDTILVESLNNTLDKSQESFSRKQWVQDIQANLDISYFGNSRVLKVLYTSSDPDLSAYIPNQIVKVFVNTATTKISSVNIKDKEKLDTQITLAKEKLERAERTLVDYSTKKGLLTSSNAQGQEALSKGLVANRLKSLQQEMDVVLAQKVIAEKKYNTYLGENANPSSLDNAQIRRLREQAFIATEKYYTSLAEFGEDDLQTVLLKQEIERFNLAIEQEISAVLSNVQSELDSLTEREVNLSIRIKNATRDFNKINSEGVKYDRLRRDVESFRLEYEGLLERVKTLAAEPVKTTNSVSILDYARPPLRPVSPDLQANLIWAAMGSILASLAIISVLSLIDSKVSSPDDVINGLSLPLLGVIPKLRVRNLISDLFDNPLSIAAEAYSTTRTRIENLEGGDGPPKCIQVTSTRASEGKSVTSLALARSYAVVGHKTLFIDADLRLPSFEGPSSDSEGLSGVLINKSDGLAAIAQTKLDNLSLLEAGKEPDDPAGLLGSTHIEKMVEIFRQEYDRIVIDGPPVLGLSDALLLSRLVDGIVIVTQSNALPFRALTSTIKAMEGAGKPIIGIILTKYKPSHGRHSHHYSKYTYGKQAMKYGQSSKQRLGKNSGKKKINL